MYIFQLYCQEVDLVILSYKFCGSQGFSLPENDLNASFEPLTSQFFTERKLW